ncbi:alanine racemase [Coriobacterium glomerans PW2]|uniref:Alanine racemase n=1 Tax=Coriobacterium glomerans (strain ATCC 49209 / DSM 20642 / JCM 10262 / PW2) TaxID=700015 RepID=F2NAE0_CORGP|nr:alanine racemase [Coriobacterium glomerans]AEB06326.1 alanine racemase [Coriobacterium glomerans PW2]
MVPAGGPATRWAWVEIDRGAMLRNTRAFKKMLKPRQRLCCVLKADAYGHGAVESSKIMRSAGADMFAVATVAEGIELRRGGCSAPVLVLGEPPCDAIPELLENDLMPAVYTSEFALAFGECAVQVDKVGKYHLAIETGMNRIGVHYTKVVSFRRGIEFHRGIQCDGVFTHFATADDPCGWDYKLQCTRFDEAVQAMRDAGFECGIVHCDNTPASILDPESHHDMIRVGIGLYGLQPADATRERIRLDPVMSVRARVMRVAYPSMGEGVGYGFTYRVPRATVQICTLPIGYADGLARTLSNRMDVLYRGGRIRQVGNICMDQTMVAIQQTPAEPIPEAEYGDLMTIVGRDGDAEVSMDEMARLRNTINYEVACDFGMRLEKIYI